MWQTGVGAVLVGDREIMTRPLGCLPQIAQQPIELGKVMPYQFFIIQTGGRFIGKELLLALSVTLFEFSDDLVEGHRFAAGP